MGVHFDVSIAVAGLVVGFLVGLTGIGGGSLTTPLMVMLLGVQPLAAVSSDLVASLVMKPFGAVIHARRGTVHWRLAGWSALGATPAAFAGALAIRVIGHGGSLKNAVPFALGLALLLAAVGTLLKETLSARRSTTAPASTQIQVNRVRTALIGGLGGLAVGMTSVGSGSLMTVLLLLTYPALSSRALVGTDLVQAIPMVGAAALGHLLVGDIRFGLTASLIVGSVPGVCAGALLASFVPTAWLRGTLSVVMLAAGLTLLSVPAGLTGIGAAILAAAWLTQGVTRAPDGSPATSDNARSDD